MQSEIKSIPMVPAFWELGLHARNKIYYGGRGGAKSWQFARALVGYAHTQEELILCTREYQSSISDSVHRLLSNQIHEMGLGPWFTIQDNIISSKVTGSEFIFKGLRRDPFGIKSTEGITKCWVEEANTISKDSLEILIPTIRKDDSELWISFNTGEIDDPVYQRFVLNPPPGSVVRKVGWQDNPYFPPALEKERQYLQRVDPDAYDHVWEGNPLHISDACVLKGKYKIEAFETPADIKLYYGSDWGFSVDPTTLVRSFIRDNDLYIDHEAYGVGVELDDIPELFEAVPGSRDWPIWADNSRPETINHLKKKVSESRELRSPGLGTMPRPTRRAQSRKGLHISGSSTASTFTNGASIRLRKPSSGDTRRTSRPATFFPFSWKGTSIAGTA